jgi:hypothetical protein
MIPIAIEYKPLWFLPWIRRIDTKLPARWSELSQKQITAIPDLNRGKLSEPKLLQIFLGISRSIARKIDSYQAHCILRNLKYIQEPDAYGSFVVKNIAGFTAPDAQLKGINFGAFIYGDTYYQNYLAGKREDLCRFIACFYYDRRGFDEKLIETHAKIIRASDTAKLEAIAINYALIREWLARAYPYVFQKAEPGQKKTQGKGWVAVFDMVVADDLVNQERYALQPVNTVLRYLNRKTKEYYKNGGKVQ